MAWVCRQEWPASARPNSRVGLSEESLQAARVELFRIAVTRIGKALRHRFGAPVEVGLTGRGGKAGEDHVAIRQLNSPARIIRRDHGLMQLFAGTDAYDLLAKTWADRGGEIGDGRRGDLGNEDLSATRQL